MMTPRKFLARLIMVIGAGFMLFAGGCMLVVQWFGELAIILFLGVVISLLGLLIELRGYRLNQADTKQFIALLLKSSGFIFAIVALLIVDSLTFTEPNRYAFPPNPYVILFPASLSALILWAIGVIITPQNPDRLFHRKLQSGILMIASLLIILLDFIIQDFSIETVTLILGAILFVLSLLIALRRY